MEDNHSTSNVEEANTTGNLTIAELTNRRLGKKTDEEQETKIVDFDANEETPEGEKPAPESSADSEPKEEPHDVLSQFDLDSLSEDELKTLSQKLSSRAVERFGELTRRTKSAEERLAQLQNEMSQSNPLDTGDVKDNPLSNITTIEGLRQKAEENAGVIEWAEDILFNSDGHGPDDVVVEVEGKQLTKADVRRSLLSARKDRDKYLPAQLKVVQAAQGAEKLKEQIQEELPKELPWTQDEASEINQHYQAMISDPRLEQIQGPPEVLAQLPYIIAHAVNSIHGNKQAAPAQQQTKTPTNRS
jgi:vacuolar-type H+-ATPase subunit I/STV1